MMFRRTAVEVLRPHKKLAYKRCADGYLAQGSHALGGTLFLQQPLIYRLLHEQNSWITEKIYSSFQNKQKEGAEQWASDARIDALEAIRANGLEPIAMRRTVKKWVKSKKGIGRHFGRWKNSVIKRIGMTAH